MTPGKYIAALLILSLSPAFCEDPSQNSSDDESFQWKPALSESALALSFANLERVVTQRETRDALGGPFWEGYVDSIEALHGWNDGDGFFTSYILHPMEGGFAGFIERQNDPRYRSVEFGNSERYWVSCIRSLAFASAYSVVWSATPLGEPGIGHVELHNKPGLVDLVDTQTLGIGWMIGEDALDRYLIKRIENHVRNPYVRAVTRSVLNPLRSYSNILALRVPWHRDSRPGIYDYTPKKGSPTETASEPVFRPTEWPQKTAFELETEPVVQRYLGRRGSYCLGAGGEGALRFSAIDLTFHMDGCELYGLARDVSGHTLNYVAGPRWRLHSSGRWTPFAQLLIGGTKVTHTTFYPQMEQEMATQAFTKHEATPDYASYHSETDTNGFTFLAETGMSYQVNSGLWWRVGELGYQRSWRLDQLRGFDYKQGLRFTMGLALTLGPWK